MEIRTFDFPIGIKALDAGPYQSKSFVDDLIYQVNETFSVRLILWIACKVINT